MAGFSKVWVVGAGAIGSVLAGLLHLAGRAKVFLVGRSVHWRAVRENGLLFSLPSDEVHRVFLAAVSPDEVPALGEEDLVLLTGKLPDFPATAAWLKPKLGKDTGVIGLYNGLGLDEYLAPLLGRTPDRGLAFLGGFSREPGQVIYFRGHLRLRPSPATRSLGEFLQGMPVECQMAENFRQAEWGKLAINCLANPLAGLLGVRVKDLRQPDLDPAKEALLAEVKAVAAAEGIDLQLTVADFNRRLTTDNVPSLRADILRGRPTEIDFLNGAIVRLGRRHGVPTPVNEVIVNLIKFLSQSGAPKAG